MAERKRLGDILKEAGLIDDFQLESALSYQKNWRGKLGSILIELGFVKESDLARVLAEKLRIPRIDPFDPPVPEEVLGLLKADIAKKHSLLPVKVEGRILTVVLSDPMDMEALDEVRFITGLAVKPALAMEGEILDAIKKYYDKEDVSHREKQTLKEKIKAGPEEMEIMRDNPDMGKQAVLAAKAALAAASEAAPAAAPAAVATEQVEPVPPAVQAEDKAERTAAKQESVTVRTLIEALVSLLISKKVITADELGELVKQKQKKGGA